MQAPRLTGVSFLSNTLKIQTMEFNLGLESHAASTQEFSKLRDSRKPLHEWGAFKLCDAQIGHDLTGTLVQWKA